MRSHKGRDIILLLVIHLCITSALTVSYDGDQVWRYSSTSEREFSFVKRLTERQGFDIWSSKKGAFDLRIPKDSVSKMAQIWSEKGIKYKILIEDVGRVIERERQTKISKSIGDSSSFNFDEYHNLDEIFDYLDFLAANSDLVTLEQIGTTFEGTSIRLVKISSQKGTSNKPAVWIDCGIHAREWISPATCLWGLNYLTSQYGVNDIITNFIDSNDLYILPVMNPDGYDYTWTEDRLWRKNRVQYPENAACLGVDLNRNYDDGHWGVVGSSSYSCDETYRGPSPFSELETSAVRATVASLQESQLVKALFSIHSYSQLWLFAFGWTGALPSQVDELNRVSEIGVEAIASVNGSVYTNGPHYDTIYPAAGTAVDWGYSMGIVHSYILELRDTGTYGFLLPEDQILPTAEETWTGLITAINAI